MSGFFEVELSFQPQGAHESFESFLDQVLEELDKIGVQADLTAALALFQATFSIPSDNYSDGALIEALSDLRAALHASDCGTPNWPDAYEVLGTRSVRAEDLVSA